MDAALLRELQNQGRFFYERFSGTAAAEEWTREREKAGRYRIFLARHAVATVAGNPQQTVPA